MGKCSLGCLALAACGHLRFDALGDGAPAGDAAADSDAAMVRCAGLAATCGPTGTSDCCASLPVPGGTFYRSFDFGSDGAWTDMSYPATLGDFQLDTYEVTVGRFRQFVDAGLGTQTNPPPSGAGARTLGGAPGQGGWDPTWNTNLAVDSPTLIADLSCTAGQQTWTDAAGANESLAINCITWFEAFAFCAWDGGFLPTEAQWNYAAVGGVDQRAFAWSNPVSSVAIDCTEANFDPGVPCVGSNPGNVVRVGSQSPVGDGKWGHSDLGGNVWEWMLDWVDVYPVPCDDCADLTSNTVRGFRGGAYNTTATQVRPATRGDAMPTFRDPANGVRCAR